MKEMRQEKENDATISQEDADKLLGDGSEPASAKQLKLPLNGRNKQEKDQLFSENRILEK